MKLNITAKNFVVSDYLEEIIEKKFSKLAKYFHNDLEMDIKITVDSGLEKMEATIFANGMLFRAEEISTDIYSTLESVVNKLEKQITKSKKKLKDRNQQGGIIYDEIEDEQETSDEDLLIVRTKRFAVKPMDTIEAALQMQLLDHNFFVFTNADTDEVNVVYKRKDGKVGLIEPEYN